MFLNALLFSAILSAAPEVPAEQVRLNSRLTKVLNALGESYYYGDWVSLGKQLSSRMVLRMKPKKLAEFDRALAERGLPSTGELMVHVRLTLQQQGRASALPKVKFPERMRMLAAIDKRVDEALESSHQQIQNLEKTPPPQKIEQYDDRLHIFDRTRRKLNAARRWASFGAGLAEKILDRVRKKLKPPQRELVEANGPQQVEGVDQFDREIVERQLELRLERLRHGVTVLQEPKLSRERFLAAYSTGLDARILLQFLRPPKADDQAQPPAAEAQPGVDPPAFQRPALNEPGLANEVARLGKQAAKLAGELADKSRLFFEGLEWWLRGRYGWGPEVMGLVKSKAALRDPQLLLSVSMPAELPTPVALVNLARLQVTHIDRRHHYTWVWDDRKLVRTAKDSKWGRTKKSRIVGYVPAIHHWSPSREDVNIRPADVAGGRANDLLPVVAGQVNASTKRFYRSIHLPPQDPRLAYRLVSFVEYGKALELLDEFVRRASFQEIEIADEIVRDSDHLVVFANLSRRLEKQPNALSERRRNERDDFSRRGLARIELGAILAGFSSVPKPFAHTAPPSKLPRLPKNYGAEEYAEMLLDGTRVHYGSLKSDPAVWNYYKTGVPENHLVTYGRRVTVARHFLAAARDYSGVRLKPHQLALLGRWEQEITKVYRMLLYCLSKKQGAAWTTVTESYSRDFVKGTSDKNIQVSQLKKDSPLTRLLLLTDPTL